MRIVQYPHPVLLHPTLPVMQVDKPLRLHVGRMFESMYDAKGVGLAANQVALPYRLLIMNLDTQNHSKENEQVYLNPVITARRGSVEDDEACLSFPGLAAKVRRAKEVTVEAYTLEGKHVKFQAKDFAARAWQHELDHLDGKVFIDRFSTLARMAHRREIHSFEHRFRKAQEEGKIPADVDLERFLAYLREHAESAARA